MKIRKFLLYLPKYFGALRNKESPLKLSGEPEGKSPHAKQIKRDKLFSLISDLTAGEISHILQAGPANWQKYNELRMHDDEIRGALEDHLCYLLREQEDQTLYHRRKVIAGIGLVAAGVWLNATIKLMPKSSSKPRRGYVRSSGRSSGR